MAYFKKSRSYRPSYYRKGKSNLGRPRKYLSGRKSFNFNRSVETKYATWAETMPWSAPVSSTNDRGIWAVNASAAFSRGLTRVTQNTTNTGRIGNRIMARRLTVHLTASPSKVFKSPNAGETTDRLDPEGGQQVTGSTFLTAFKFVRTIVRVLIVQDLQTISDQTGLPWATVMDTTGDVNAPSVQNFMNTDTLGRFKILANKYITLDQNDPCKQVTITCSNMVRDIRFNGPANTDIQKNGIYIFAAYLTPDAQLSDYTEQLSPVLSWTGRLSFIDP